jgi:hypothetical protein
MELCPKCKGKGIYTEITYGTRRNVCIYCGLQHCIGGARQSLERQISKCNVIYGVGVCNITLKDLEEAEDASTEALYYLSSPPIVPNVVNKIIQTLIY